MKIEVIDITPSMASIFLSKNNSNRKINKPQLEMIKRAILKNEWATTHQGIAFYEDGSLADGQHRLTAILETGISCEMVVYHGIKKDVDTIMALDCGRARNVQDNSKMTTNEVKVKDLSIAKGLEFGYIKKHEKLSHKESFELCIKHKEKIDLINEVCKSNIKFVGIVPVRVAIGESIDSKFTSSDAAEFYKVLCSGMYERHIMRNAVVLRNKLMSKNYNGGHDRHRAHMLTIKTINGIKENKQIKVLREV